MTDEGTHCPAVRHGEWPGAQVTGGRVVGGGVGRNVAENNIKKKIVICTNKSQCMYERKSFLNIIHTRIGNKLPCNIRYFVKFILPNTRHETSRSHTENIVMHCKSKKLAQHNLGKGLITNKPKISLSHTRALTCRTGNTTGNHRTVHRLRRAHCTPPPFRCGFTWTLLCHLQLSSISHFLCGSTF